MVKHRYRAMGNTIMNMSAEPWSKAQAANNKKFKAKLDRPTNYLAEGDWHSSYNSATYADGDTVTSFSKAKTSCHWRPLASPSSKMAPSSCDASMWMETAASIPKATLLASSLFRTLFMFSVFATTILGLGRLAGDREC